ncbi:IniB N-terminal domain-containing protein [Dactylosporangium roseum]|uniref:IniB N-terminal domain-containing protein n=1 Tax=Dactylosporangium roseum TaxID=47989 RepID=A0ABY5ZA05_9ACTN|nr:IniB N-terminal domain-containing protein [Dactylosporangium roseum]UWZ38876.1 IniB N-terminal domain-containing protein [Dactylosporangium roseum]
METPASPTLHDFVLNLLTDPAARSAFELDPEGVLVDAGLGDITEADVQDVIPLVMDYAPIGGLTEIVGTDDATLGFDGDVTGAVRQLQGITQFAVVGSRQAHGHGSDMTVNATAVAGASVGLGGLSLAPAGLPVPGAVPGALDLSLLGDPAGTLDAVDPVVGGTTGTVVDTVDPVLDTTDPVVHSVDPILGTVDPVLGGVYGTVDVTLSTATDLEPVDSLGLGGVADTGTVTDTVDATVSNVTGSVVSGHGDGLTGGLLGGSGAPAEHDQDHGGLLGHLH